MGKIVSKPKRKRDSQALQKTLAFFVSRDGKPTTIKMASRHLKVPSSRLYARVSALTKSGDLYRVDKGVYVSSQAVVPQPASQEDSNEQLLASLLKEREHLDTQIEKVRAVIELKKQWGVK